MFPRRPPSSIQHHGGKEYAAKNLFMLAVGILNLPTSSASVERSFSQHSNIHSLPRNRLTNQRAAKLLFISHNFKVINPKNNQKKNIALDSNEEKEFEESNEVEPETDAESDDVFELSEVNPSQIASTSTGADLPDISPASGGKAVETSFGFGDCVLQQDSMP